MEHFFKEIRQKTKGTLLTDEVSRAVYSVDASIYELKPLAIFIPETIRDVKAAIAIAENWHVEITARGAATGITGACLGGGLIIDGSKSLQKILEINIEEGYVLVEPGVIQDDLNEALAPYHYRLGPDTSTGNRATLGGMLANNAAGSRSLKYGRMVDHVLEVELLLSTGETLHLKEISKKEALEKAKLHTQEGLIYRTVLEEIESKRNEIEKIYPKIPRHVSGYNLDTLLNENKINLAKLIAGSEGTLGFITKIKMAIAKALPKTALVVFPFDTLEEAFLSVPELLKANPISLELLDDHVIKAGLQSASLKKEAEFFDLLGKKALLAAEIESERENAFNEVALEKIILNDQKKIKAFWDIRKGGLGLLLSKRDYTRAVAFIEDVALHPSLLHDFMNEFLLLLKNHGKEAGIYGHAGSGCMHIRPYLDLLKEDERHLLKKLMEKTADLVLKYHGALSGEHGDGLIRSWLNQKMFGEAIYSSFVEIKKAFDPTHIMNPGKIVDGQDPLENIRVSPNKPVETFIDFKDEGGLALAADLCNGNGLCRKKEGLMCPSFQATDEEFHSTRARAVALRNVIRGDLGHAGLASPELMDVLDLCLVCKGCKTECPSSVDMAKMKAEVLYHYHKKNGYSLRDKLFGNIGDYSKIASLWPSLANYLSHSKFIHSKLDKIGITPKRPLPVLAPLRFSKLAKKQGVTDEKAKVVLFNDTFNEFYEPEIGLNLLSLFQKMDLEVIIPPWSCCGRTLISKGFLEKAVDKAKKLVKVLYPYAEKGIPIVGIEPSCILTLKDDLVSLVSNQSKEMTDPLKQIAAVSMTLSEFLASQFRYEKPNIAEIERLEVHIHGHCHEKALIGFEPLLELFKNFPFLDPKIIPSGCCGVAGSFGYEKEHFDLSMKIGNLELLPYVKKLNSEAIIVASGFSCRSQLKLGAGIKALHLGELINSIVTINSK